MMVPQEFTGMNPHMAVQFRNAPPVRPMQMQPPHMQQPQMQQTFSVVEYCQAISHEFQFMERQLNGLKNENMQIKQQKAEIQEHYTKTHSMLIKANREIQRQNEINSNLSNIINGMLDHLSSDVKESVLDQLERLKSMTSDELRNRIERERPRSSMHNSGLMNFHSDDESDPMLGSKKQKMSGPTNSFGIPPSVMNSGLSHLGPSSSSSIHHGIPGTMVDYDSQNRGGGGGSGGGSLNVSGGVGGGHLDNSSSADSSPIMSHHHHHHGNNHNGGSNPTTMGGNHNNSHNSSMGMHGMNSNNSPPLDDFKKKRTSSMGGSAGGSSNNSPSLSTIKRSKSPPPLIPQTQDTSNIGVPRSARMISTLNHGDIVCAVAINNTTRRVYTGARGVIKIWDINNLTPQIKSIGEIRCLNDQYIRSCKVTANGKTMVMGGESNMMGIWDLGGASPMMKNTITVLPPRCYALSLNQDESGFFSCHSDGTVALWDINNGKQLRTFKGHTEGVSSVDISPDGSKVLTGSFDGTLRVFDIGTSKELGVYSFPSQIFAMGICPGESWVAVGLENSHVEVLNLMNSNCKYQMLLHEACVLSIKFANSGKWFVSTGKDRLLNSWRSPFGSTLFQCREPNTILCCDISADDNYLVTGSGEKLATVYEVIY